MSRYMFNAQDGLRFLRPKYFYVGAMYDGTEDQLPRFVSEGIWENGHQNGVKKYNLRYCSIQKGDVLLVKRMLGKGKSEMRILAIGIVVGKDPHDAWRLRVEWSIPELAVKTPFHEPSTISAAQDNIPNPLMKYADKARGIFLRANLNIQQTFY